MAVVFYINSPIVLLISLAGMGVWLWISVGLGQSVQWQVLGVCISVIPAALASTASYGLLMLFGLPDSPVRSHSNSQSPIFLQFLLLTLNFFFLLLDARSTNSFFLKLPPSSSVWSYTISTTLPSYSFRHSLLATSCGCVLFGTISL